MAAFTHAPIPVNRFNVLFKDDKVLSKQVLSFSFDETIDSLIIDFSECTNNHVLDLFKKIDISTIAVIISAPDNRNLYRLTFSGCKSPLWSSSFQRLGHGSIIYKCKLEFENFTKTDIQQG